MIFLSFGPESDDDELLLLIFSICSTRFFNSSLLLFDWAINFCIKTLLFCCDSKDFRRSVAAETYVFFKIKGFWQIFWYFSISAEFLMADLYFWISFSGKTSFWCHDLIWWWNSLSNFLFNCWSGIGKILFFTFFLTSKSGKSAFKAFYFFGWTAGEVRFTDFGYRGFSNCMGLGFFTDYLRYYRLILGTIGFFSCIIFGLWCLTGPWL